MPRATPPVGTVVQYFKDGNTAGTPSAAIVQECLDNGLCTLAVQPTTGRQPVICEEFVYYDGDPEYQIRQKDGLTCNGVYRLVPKDVPIASDEDLEAEKKLLKEQAEARSRATKKPENKKAPATATA